MAIPNVTETVKRATTSPCPACAVNEILRECAIQGAMAKSATLRKSKAVRAIYAHKCEQKGNTP